MHKLVGDIYVEDINNRGGLLGRKVEWIVKDDQSKPDVARTLYEQLVTSDKVVVSGLWIIFMRKIYC